MYLAVAAIILGQALMFGQPVLLLYTAAFAVAVVAFVRRYEEPTLRSQSASSTRRIAAQSPRGGHAASLGIQSD